MAVVLIDGIPSNWSEIDFTLAYLYMLKEKNYVDDKDIVFGYKDRKDLVCRYLQTKQSESLRGDGIIELTSRHDKDAFDSAFFESYENINIESVRFLLLAFSLAVVADKKHILKGENYLHFSVSGVSTVRPTVFSGLNARRERYRDMAGKIFASPLCNSDIKECYLPKSSFSADEVLPYKFYFSVNERDSRRILLDYLLFADLDSYIKKEVFYHYLEYHEIIYKSFEKNFSSIKRNWSKEFVKYWKDFLVQDGRPSLIKDISDFSYIAASVILFDFSQGERKVFLQKVLKTRSQSRYREKHSDKISFTFELRKDTKRQLDIAANTQGISRAELLSRLIEIEYSTLQLLKRR